MPQLSPQPDKIRQTKVAMSGRSLLHNEMTFSPEFPKFTISQDPTV
jgi:hypothetical protein